MKCYFFSLVVHVRDVRILIPSTLVLATVSNLVVDADEDAVTVTLSWSFTVGDIPREFLDFRLVFESASPTLMTVVDAPATGTTFNATVQAIGVDLEERTMYTLTVTAVNLLGDGSQAAQQMFMTGIN